MRINMLNTFKHEFVSRPGIEPRFLQVLSYQHRVHTLYSGPTAGGSVLLGVFVVVCGCALVGVWCVCVCVCGGVWGCVCVLCYGGCPGAVGTVTLPHDCDTS